MYTLRPAFKEDFEWLKKLHHDVMRDSVEQIWGWDVEFQDELFERQFDPGGKMIVQVNGRDVGVLEVERRDQEIFLSNVQIAVEMQGRGLGSELIRALQHEAGERGVALVLQVNKANSRAHALYDRLGFRPSGETDTHFLMTWEP